VIDFALGVIAGIGLIIAPLVIVGRYVMAHPQMVVKAMRTMRSKRKRKLHVIRNNQSSARESSDIDSGERQTGDSI
jgi:hypothetical protein